MPVNKTVDISSILWELGEKFRMEFRTDEEIDRTYSGQLNILLKIIKKMCQSESKQGGIIIKNEEYKRITNGR